MAVTVRRRRRDFLALFEQVVFGLVAGELGRYRGLLAILGIVVGVLILGIAAGAGNYG